MTSVAAGLCWRFQQSLSISEEHHVELYSLVSMWQDWELHYNAVEVLCFSFAQVFFRCNFSFRVSGLCMEMETLFEIAMECSYTRSSQGDVWSLWAIGGQTAVSQPLEWQDHCCLGADMQQHSTFKPDLTLELDGMYQVLG
jgi:hypothetical protein